MPPRRLPTRNDAGDHRRRSARARPGEGQRAAHLEEVPLERGSRGPRPGRSSAGPAGETHHRSDARRRIASARSIARSASRSTSAGSSSSRPPPRGCGPGRRRVVVDLGPADEGPVVGPSGGHGHDGPVRAAGCGVQRPRAWPSLRPAHSARSPRGGRRGPVPRRRCRGTGAPTSSTRASTAKNLPVSSAHGPTPHARRPGPRGERTAGSSGSRARPPNSAPSTTATPSSSWRPPSSRPSAPTSGSTRRRRRCSPGFPTPASLAAAAGGGGRGPDPPDRLLPGQDPQPRRHGHRGGRAVRRRGADAHGGPRDAARRRTQDGERAPQRGFGLPGLPVDTHVQRLSVRLGLTTATDPVKVEHELGRHGAGRRAGRVQPPVDPPRP